jgi:hypothetical protein
LELIGPMRQQYGANPALPDLSFKSTVWTDIAVPVRSVII